MLTLAFESSAKTASVALSRSGVLLGQYFQNSGLTHSVTLLPMAEALLKNNALTPADIDLFAVAHGPGSFTGIRIGVSTVKGLAWALEKPCVGVSTLEAMAWNGLCAPADTVICCAMDARRNQVYNALFRLRDGVPERLSEDRAIDLETLRRELLAMGKGVFLTGDGALLARDALAETGLPLYPAPEPVRFQSAWGVLMAARDKAPVSVHDLLPVYLRLSQAERERQARLDAART